MQRLINLARRAKNYTNTHRIQSIVGGGIFVAAFLYTVAFLLPQPIDFSYSGDNCVSRLTLLPEIHSSPDTSRFDVAFQDDVSIGQLALASFKTCVEPTGSPKKGTVVASTAPFGSYIARSHLAVDIPEAPQLDTSALSEPFPASKPLDIALTTNDSVFTYKLQVADRTAPCKSVSHAIRCDIPKLALKQDKQYEAVLFRQFKHSTPTKLIASPVRTLKAATITKGTIKAGQTVYDRPKSLMYSADKNLISAKIALTKLDKKREDIPLKSTVSGENINIILPAELDREKKYELVIKQVEAIDGSTLAEPYKIPFTVSGGPKVKVVNVGSSRVDSNAVIILDFDQPLLDGQPIGSFVRINGGGATITKLSPTRVSLALANLPRCAPFSIEVLAGLKSKHDITLKTQWKFASRTICYSLSTIGTSTQGRAINAYTFGGNGPATLFVGGLHGNEVSSSLILQDWVSELETNYSRMPANSRVVVVPSVNPDGIAAGTRNNARNVNLNRNFPTDNWVKDIDDTNGRVKGGGGASPLSEPEAKALASLSSSLRPRLMLSYHAVGSVVIGDPGGYSAGYAAKYASMVGYRNATGQSAGTFDYSITGSYEDWTIQKAGIPSMVIELGSYGYRNFTYHKEAFWAMLR